MNDSARTVVLLIRHAQTDAVGDRLPGRVEDLPLNQVGRAQAERLRARLATTDIAAVYSSPLQRAIETAGPLAGERNLRIEPLLELLEVDFGEWSGERFEALARDPRWSRFNKVRSLSAPPGGERPLETQARVVRALEIGRTRHPNQTVVFVTHADVIRLAILYTAGAPIDFIHRFDILPASVTAIALDGEQSTLLYVNDRDARTPL
jgi:broad specificity phosphatase PhoE